MGERKKYIKFVVLFLIVASCWAGNIYYYEKSKIDSALFFKSYKEADVDGKYDTSNGMVIYSRVDLKLYYIQNNNNSEICRVEFPEINSGDFNVDSYDVQSYGNNKICCLDFSSSDDTFMYILEKKYLHEDYFYVTKMNFWTKDNKKYEVNLGKIYFLNEMNSEEDSGEPYSHVMSSSSSDGTGKSTFTTKSGMSINGVQSHISDDVKKYVDVSIDKDNIDKVNFQIKIDKGKSVEIPYKLKNNDEIISFDMKLNFIVRAGMVKTDMPVYINNNSWICNTRINLEAIKTLKNEGMEAHEVSGK